MMKIKITFNSRLWKNKIFYSNNSNNNFRILISKIKIKNKPNKILNPIIKIRFYYNKNNKIIKIRVGVYGKKHCH